MKYIERGINRKRRGKRCRLREKKVRKGERRHQLDVSPAGAGLTLKAGLGMRLWKSLQGEAMFTGTAHFLSSGTFSFGCSTSPFVSAFLGDEDGAAS